MNLNEAQAVCQRIGGEYDRKRMTGSVTWNDVYESENELLNDLKKVFIPEKREAPPATFIGYSYIYSFAYYVQKGWPLSDKQMAQAKRIAVEIRKAASIAGYRF